MLEKINLPDDIKKLKIPELKELSQDIRQQIISVVYENGGHLSSNLGTVELTVALHYVFNTPDDKLIFDVGHQCYAHKIITGRKDKISTLRKFGGISGFTNPSESKYDCVTAGHSSTSLSQSLGFCRARDLSGGKYNIVAVIGDGALSGGMAFEALNDIGNSKTKLIIVLNDNEMSIEKNVGAVSRHLTKLRLSKSYRYLKKGFRKFIFSIPLIGKPINIITDAVKRLLLKIFVSKSIFDCLGIKYVGTYDGNDLLDIIKALKNASEMDRPVLIHIYTKKGKGYAPSEENPSKFHSVKKGFVSTQTDFSKCFGKELCSLAEADKKIVAVTAAMKDGTGLTEFSEKFGGRFFDVGICEQHAVTMCAGMASGGLKPYFSVYSTFLQRAFDQISNDICIPNLPVTFIIDRAGLVGSDGETHHGVLDISYLCCLPNMTVYSPKDLTDLSTVLKFSLNFNSPLAIRYGNEYFGEFENHFAIKYGKWEIISALKDINIISYGGRMLHIALDTKKLLTAKGKDIGIINAAFIKPLDELMLKNLKGICVVLEECMPFGSLYSSICAYICKENLPLRAVPVNLSDKYITHGKTSKLLDSVGISPENIANIIKNL